MKYQVLLAAVAVVITGTQGHPAIESRNILGLDSPNSYITPEGGLLCKENIDSPLCNPIVRAVTDSAKQDNYFAPPPKQNPAPKSPSPPPKSPSPPPKSPSPPPKSPSPPQKPIEAKSYKRAQKVPGIPQLKVGEWYGIIRSKDTVVKDKDGKDVLTCHESLVIGHVVVSKNREGKDELRFEGRMYEMVLQPPPNREKKLTKSLLRDLPQDEDENKYKFTLYKGIVPQNWRDFKKIEALAEEYIKSMPPSWTWEENNCQMYAANVWKLMHERK